VNYWFGQGEARKQVLYDNNLDLYPGELVIMTGPSGSGKTTLLTLIGALRSVQEGSIRVMGQELTGLDQRRLIAVRREIGFIFQAHNLFDALTAFQNVRMSLELKPLQPDQMRRRATEILARLGLEHRIHYKPQALSGGQRQRVAIARALVNRPALVLADEPTAALDKDSSHDVVRLLKELTGQDHCTVLMITHDNRILDIADRIVNMQDGSITSNLIVEETVSICEHLRSCSLFAGLAPDTLTDLAEKMTREEFPCGAVILRQGEPGDKLYLIREGSVAVIAEERERHVIDTIGPGDVFGEGSLLTGRPRNATIQAREDVVLYAIEGADATAVLESCSTLKEQLLRVFFQRSLPRE
jgi:putative ABC transport system ATP-binding protein